MTIPGAPAPAGDALDAGAGDVLVTDLPASRPGGPDGRLRADPPRRPGRASARPMRAGAARRTRAATASRRCGGLGEAPENPRLARAVDRPVLLRGRRRSRRPVRRRLPRVGLRRPVSPRPARVNRPSSKRPACRRPRSSNSSRLHDVRRREIRQPPPRRRQSRPHDRAHRASASLTGAVHRTPAARSSAKVRDRKRPSARGCSGCPGRPHLRRSLP